MADFKRGLGRGFNARGLSALIDTGEDDKPENSSGSSENGVVEIDIMKIEPNKKQPRRKIDSESLDELAESIKQVGIIQPLIVTKDGEFYEIVAGERRYRAARQAGLDKVPVIIRDYNELEALQTALIENIQREDLNPVDEAMTYKRFNEEFSLSQEEIAKKVGKNRSTVANSMRLLKLDKRVLKIINDKKLTTGHGKALLALEDKDLQYEFADRIVKEELSVRKAEEMVKLVAEVEEQVVKENKRGQKEIDTTYAYVENELRSILGAKVHIKKVGKKKKLEIEFYSDEQIDGFYNLIKGSVAYGG
ncbi:MAG: ParB/RepB/Spo0J family partition protein [Clostridiales bacterium]|nr:ParB/RepB/Spo0J family partition protein [Clostridiales bacterium]